MADILLVDCRGLECPLPIIQVRLALNKSKKGEIMSELSDAIQLVFRQQYIFWAVASKIAADERQDILDQEKFIVSLGR